MAGYCKRCGSDTEFRDNCGSCGMEFCEDCAARSEWLDGVCGYCQAEAIGCAPPDGPEIETLNDPNDPEGYQMYLTLKRSEAAGRVRGQ